VPPARGLLSVTYFVPDAAPILARGAAYGASDLGRTATIYGAGRTLLLTSPSGLRLQIIERPAAASESTP
jgi:hypothetical protein